MVPSAPTDWLMAHTERKRQRRRHGQGERERERGGNRDGEKHRLTERQNGLLESAFFH